MKQHELKNKANQLNQSPGVYLMKAKDESLLYIGKSKHLKRRVSSYFGEAKQLKPKIQRMVRNIETFEIIETDTELDALILECRLIKYYKPMYNTLLKQDQKYGYLKLDTTSQIPKVDVTYTKEDKGLYFGPFDFKNKLSLAAEAINKYYKLGQCVHPPSLEGCLAYRRERCSGWCELSFDHSQRQVVSHVIAFLEGRNMEVISFYEEAMHQACERLDFEKAMTYRDYLSVLKLLHFKKAAYDFALKNQLGIAAVPIDESRSKVYILLGTCIQESYSVNKAPKQALSAFDQRQIKAKYKQVNPRTYLEKSEVDEAQIIYNYIHLREDVSYILIN